MCILLGCDYCESIKGIGPKKAFDLVKTNKCIEKIIQVIDKKVPYFYIQINENNVIYIFAEILFFE